MLAQAPHPPASVFTLGAGSPRPALRLVARLAGSEAESPGSTYGGWGAESGVLGGLKRS